MLEAIRDLGLELQVIFNKGAVMVLPPGVNKATGLAAALDGAAAVAAQRRRRRRRRERPRVPALCGCSVAVANALAAVKETADIVTARRRAAPASSSSIDRLLGDGRGRCAPADRHARRRSARTRTASRSRCAPDGEGVLIAGTSGIGKSTLATALLERLAERGFQFCVLDPEGDYEELEDAVVLGDAKRVPAGARGARPARRARRPNVVVNMLGLEVARPPGFFAGLLPQIAALRAGTGRPHWLLIDEAHHLLPAAVGRRRP